MTDPQERAPYRRAQREASDGLNRLRDALKRAYVELARRKRTS